MQRNPSFGAKRATTAVGITVLLAVLAAVGQKNPAHAAGLAIALEQQADGLRDDEKRLVRDAASAALVEQQYERIDPSEVESIWAGEASLRGCFTESCLERLGRLIASKLVVFYQVKVTRDGSASAETAPTGKSKGASSRHKSAQPSTLPALPPGTFSLRVTVFDVDVGAVGATLTDDCAGCTTEAAAEKLADAVKRAVLENAARARGKLEILSEPPSALVFVDGNELGNTPYKRVTFAGSHDIIIRSNGYLSQQHKVTIEESQKQTLNVKLVAGTDPTPAARTEKPLYKKWWFWTAIGGAVVVAGAITAGVVVGSRSEPADRVQSPNHLSFSF